MKRKLLTLGMALICVFSMTACGGTEDTSANAESLYGITQDSAISYADQVIGSIQTIVAQNMQEQYASDAVISAALDSWESALEDIGEVQGMSGHTVAADEDGVTIDVHVDGSEHDANIVITLDDELALSSITTNVEYSFGELMENAALNTVLGMGTVFVVLILISLIIYAMGYIPKIQARFAKGKEETEVLPSEEKAPVMAAEPQDGEPETDDTQLVVVITAAIAASEDVPVDQLVVRSIRRRPSAHWKHSQDMRRI